MDLTTFGTVSQHPQEDRRHPRYICRGGSGMDEHESRLCTGLSCTYYRIFSIGILETDQRSFGLDTSNCTIEMASVGQRTIHRPQRIHFSSSMIISAPPLQASVPRCIGSPLTTRERPSMLIQS